MPSDPTDMGEARRCGKCEHWEPLGFPQPIWDDQGDETGKAPGGWGFCSLVEFLCPKSGSDKFYVQDASDYKADLVTREDFGCSEWQAKHDA